MEALFIIISIITGFVGLWFFIKTTDDSIEIDRENVEKAKVFLNNLAEKLRLKEIFVMTLGEIFKFIQELPSRSKRATWNVRKELMLIMLMGVIFYSVHLIGYTFSPYIVTALIALVVFGLRKSGHLKNSEDKTEKEEEKVEVPNYENMSDIQVGLDMAKSYIKKAYDLSIGATIEFIIKSSTRQGRNTLLLEQELVLAGILTVPYVYFGWAAFKITLIIILGDYIIQLLRGKRATYEEIQAELDEKNTELESLRKQLEEAGEIEGKDQQIGTLNEQVTTLTTEKQAISEKFGNFKQGAMHIISGKGNKTQKLEAFNKLVDQIDS